MSAFISFIMYQCHSEKMSVIEYQRRSHLPLDSMWCQKTSIISPRHSSLFGHSWLILKDALFLPPALFLLSTLCQVLARNSSCHRYTIPYSIRHLKQICNYGVYHSSDLWFLPYHYYYIVYCRYSINILRVDKTIFGSLNISLL